VESPLPQTERFPLDQDLRVQGSETPSSIRSHNIGSSQHHESAKHPHDKHTSERALIYIARSFLSDTRTRPAPTSANFNLPAMLRSTLIAAATLAACAFAVPQITIPAAGASIPAGPITVTWTDDGKAPKLTLLKSATLQLIVGGNGATDNVCETAYQIRLGCGRRGSLE
jgi:hypothetical protein